MKPDVLRPIDFAIGGNLRLNGATRKYLRPAEMGRILVRSVGLWNGLEMLATLALATAVLSSLALCLAALVSR